MLQLLGGNQRQSLGLNFRPGLAGGCWVSRGWGAGKRRLIQCRYRGLLVAMMMMVVVVVMMVFVRSVLPFVGF